MHGYADKMPIKYRGMVPRCREMFAVSSDDACHRLLHRKAAGATVACKDTHTHNHPSWACKPLLRISGAKDIHAALLLHPGLDKKCTPATALAPDVFALAKRRMMEVLILGETDS